MKIEATTTRIVLTLKKAIPKNANKNKIKAKMLEKIFFLNPHKTFVSRAATTTFIPAKAFFTVIFSLKPDKNFAIIEIMIIEGVTTPNVAMIAPRIPAREYPKKVDRFIAILLGVICPLGNY